MAGVYDEGLAVGNETFHLVRRQDAISIH
jgi:hypothetical protein